MEKSLKTSPSLEEISPRFFAPPIYLDHNKDILLLAVLDNTLKEKYKDRVREHNNMIETNKNPDSGFDLLIPDEIEMSGEFVSKLIDMKIKCEMRDKTNLSIPYYIHPRSSIYKTPLMLANSAGIIDSGYRGNIKVALRLFNKSYQIKKYTRLTQICLPSLKPFLIKLVEPEDLSETIRGTGGFGSTGR